MMNSEKEKGMMYFIWLVGAIMSLLISIYAWNQYNAINIREINKHKKEMAITIIAVLSTIALFCCCMQRDYLYTDMAKIILTYILLLSLAMIDYKHHIIPNRIILMAILGRLIILGVEYYMFPEQFLAILVDCGIGAIVGFGILFVVSIICKQGIGMGDVKLIGTIGLIQGIISAYNILFYGLFFLVIFIIVMWLLKKVSRNSQIPFAPFVYIGYAVAVACNIV